MVAYTDHDFMVTLIGDFESSSHLLWSNSFAVNLEDSTNPEDAIGVITSAWTDVIVPNQAINAAVRTVIGRRLSDNVFVEGPADITGDDGTSIFMPSNVALVFTHLASNGTITVKGRTFFAYMANNIGVNAANPSIWGTDTHDTYAGMMGDFLAAVNGADHSPQWSVNSRLHSTLLPISASTLNMTPGQQGGRRYG
jgi:hypothetical protein